MKLVYVLLFLSFVDLTISINTIHSLRQCNETFVNCSKTRAKVITGSEWSFVGLGLIAAIVAYFLGLFAVVLVCCPSILIQISKPTTLKTSKDKPKPKSKSPELQLDKTLSTMTAAPKETSQTDEEEAKEKKETDPEAGVKMAETSRREEEATALSEEKLVMSQTQLKSDRTLGSEIKNVPEKSKATQISHQPPPPRKVGFFTRLFGSKAKTPKAVPKEETPAAPTAQVQVSVEKNKQTDSEKTSRRW